MEKKSPKRKEPAPKKSAARGTITGQRTTGPRSRETQQSHNSDVSLEAAGADAPRVQSSNDAKSPQPQDQRHNRGPADQNGVFSRTLSAAACVVVIVAFLLCQVAGQHNVTAQNRCTPKIGERLSKEARALAAQIAFTPLEQPISIRRLLLGAAPDVAAIVTEVVGAIPGASVVTIGATDIRGMTSALGNVPIDTCCTILWIPAGHLLGSDGAGALKSLVETGGVGGRRYLSSRTALIVGAPSEKAIDHLPDRWKQLFTRVEVPVATV